MSSNDTPITLVVTEAVDERKVGDYIGQCKWFSDKLGYGFVTIQNGEHKGKDIFVHHSGIHPLNSNYNTLKKGEYVNLNIITGDHGLQAIDVTGILGGSLMCDVIPTLRVNLPVVGETPSGRQISYRQPYAKRPYGQYVKIDGDSAVPANTPNDPISPQT